MKKILVASMCLLGMTMTVFADWAMRGVGELPINDTASWGGNPLTDNTNYRLGSIEGTTIGTVSAPDNFTLMSTTSNLLIVADIADSVGVIDMDGGTFNLAGKMRLGNNSTASATLNLSGGNLTTGGNLEIARFQSGVTGIVNMSGGTLQVNGHILVGNVANTGETAEFNYTGGTVSMTGEFQLQGTLNFMMGLGPIVANHRVGNEGVISLMFPGDYSHVNGVTQMFIQSETAFQTISLATDSGLVGITPEATGTSVTVNGYDFNILWTDGAGGGIGVTAVSAVVPAPGIRIAIEAGTDPVIAFPSESGVLYQLQKSLDLLPESWADVTGQSVTGDGTEKTLSDAGAVSGDTRVFYRVTAN